VVVFPYGRTCLQTASWQMAVLRCAVAGSMTLRTVQVSVWRNSIGGGSTFAASMGISR
jgi:hypothetical protein